MTKRAYAHPLTWDEVKHENPLKAMAILPQDIIIGRALMDYSYNAPNSPNQERDTERERERERERWHAKE